ncbi:MAG: BatD family protein [Saprospiraceae bacterium]
MRPTLLYLLLLFAISAFAQNGPVTFMASANARQVVIGSYFEVSYTLMNANGENFKAPSFEGFTLLSGPNRSISTSSINGRYTRELIYTYTLQPKKIGTYTIKGATVMVAGKKMTSNAVKVQVLKGKEGASSQADFQKRIEKEVFIKAVPSTPEAYIGQQILLDYKIYTTLDVSTYNLISESEYDGFFMQDIRRIGTTSSREVIDGVEFTTQIIKRVALFPQQAGALTIDPMQMRLAIVREEDRNKRRGFFQMKRTVPVVVETPPLTINVRRLPGNAPPTFTGAVGKYFMTVAASNNNLTTDESITLQMTFTGDGDIKQVQAPPILIDNIEVYEPRVISENSEEMQSRIVAKKVIEYLLLPQEAGRYNIAPEFTYFDTDSLRYITLKGSDNIFDVKKGVKRKAVVVQEEEDPFANAVLKPLKKNTSLSKKGSSFFASLLYWILMVIPLFVFGGVVAYRQKQLREGNVDQVLLRKQRAAKVAKEQLATAEQFLKNNDSRSFYNEVSHAALGYISDKLNMANADLSKGNIKEKLIELNVPQERIEPFIEMLKTCERALYGGMNNAAAMQETYDKAAGIIGGIEEGID